MKVSKEKGFLVGDRVSYLASFWILMLMLIQAQKKFKRKRFCHVR